MSHARPRLGIVGGGQLARMTALAATALDVPVSVLEDDREAPATAAAERIPGSPRSLAALRRLAERTDVVTFDHELAPPVLLAALAAEGHTVAPPPAAKLLAQDKVAQRRFVGDELRLPVPEHRVVRDRNEVDRFASDFGWPLILKLASGGYDGRGVWVAADAAAAEPALAAARAAGTVVLAERRVAIDRELSVIVARSTCGDHVVYPVAETIQVDGMCQEIIAPAPIASALASEAQELAVGLAQTIGATGILAVEMFVSEGNLLINELALRPHNSGHFTLGGCRSSQFENHVRAVLGWPLGDPSLNGPAVACANVVGQPDLSDPRDRLPTALVDRGAAVQLYGKVPRPNRKLGHVTVVGDSLQEARRRARQAAARLEGRAA